MQLSGMAAGSQLANVAGSGAAAPGQLLSSMRGYMRAPAGKPDFLSGKIADFLIDTRWPPRLTSISKTLKTMPLTSARGQAGVGQDA